jgi:hypothetical protein
VSVTRRLLASRVAAGESIVWCPWQRILTPQEFAFAITLAWRENPPGPWPDYCWAKCQDDDERRMFKKILLKGYLEPEHYPLRMLFLDLGR